MSRAIPGPARAGTTPILIDALGSVGVPIDYSAHGLFWALPPFPPQSTHNLGVLSVFLPFPYHASQFVWLSCLPLGIFALAPGSLLPFTIASILLLFFPISSCFLAPAPAKASEMMQFLYSPQSLPRTRYRSGCHQPDAQPSIKPSNRAVESHLAQLNCFAYVCKL